MKTRQTFLNILLVIALLFRTAPETHAQLLRSVQNEVRNRAERQVVNTAGEATDAGINKAKKETVNTVRGNQSAEASAGSTNSSVKTTAAAATPKPAVDYKNYDFVPGDKIIFQPDMSSEPDAELPARFSIIKGNAEIQSYEGEKLLHLNSGGYVIITPLMNATDYLPEQFTVEFDIMYENDKDYFSSVNDFDVNFFKAEETNWNMYPLFRFRLHSNESVAFGTNASAQKVPEALKTSLQTNNTWHHIAIYVRKNIGKAYIDQHRIVATNNMPTGAGKLAIATDGRYGFKIKNLRIAAGGEDKYNRIITDGKFITHGILFDVNKSTISPASMGTLNEVVKLMSDHADLNFEIQGHTDSDGADAANLLLSQQRADAVKKKLTEMGVEASRLSAKGFGETKPIDNNNSDEGRANNRRVEFVKR